MSWIFGIISSDLDSDQVARVEGFLPKPLFAHKSRDLYIACGGLKETCLSSLMNKTKENSRGWIACGLGISPANDETKHILTGDDWEVFFAKPEPKLENIEGHFVAVTWDQDRIFGYVDARGIRDLFVARFNNYILISTRLDWFGKFGVECTIDFARFGSRWLAFNQLSNKSVVNGVDRLGPGGRIEIHKGDYSIAQLTDPYVPAVSKPLAETVVSLSTLAQRTGYKIITCLSGGLDSRVLLTALLSLPIDQWKVCIFGSENHPDVKIARKIVYDLRLDHFYFDNEIPDEVTTIRLMRDYVAHTQCIGPATEAVRFNFYSQLHQPNHIVIDGAFGEIMRRSYFNRLLFRGRSALVSGSVTEIAPHLKVRRADIFNEEVLRVMNRGFMEDLTKVSQKFFKCNNLGSFEDALDRLAIYTRLPNLFGPEVSRLDHLVQNYMPFAQSSFLAAVLKTELHLRRGGHFSKDFIRQKQHHLTRYALAKEDYIYPFSLSSAVLNWTWRSTLRALGLTFQGKLKAQILTKLEQFIRDTVASQETRSFAGYEMKKINSMVSKFYAGDDQYADDLAWWLSFELWRQACLFT